MRVICMDCRNSFEAEEGIRRVSDRYHVHGSTRIEYELACPECGGTDIEDAAWCSGCHKYAVQGEITSGLCPDCQRELDKRQHDLRRIVETVFSAAEIKYIKAEQDGWINVFGEKKEEQ